METAMVVENCEEREEGEIIDDDNDFEDISDSSLILPVQIGKCDSPKEHLRGISLSSIDAGDPACSIRCRRKSTSKKRQKLEKRRNSRRKSVISVSDSDEEDGSINLYRRQIKAAIRIENQDSHHNSLKARLKLLTSENDDDLNNTSINDGISPIPDEEETSKTSEDNHMDIDNELIQLRAEALKTALVNKFKSRKKRKIKTINHEDTLSDIDVKSDISETNKENNRNENISLPSPVDLGNEQKTDLNATADDDEDVLRAMLLASMSKKITQEQDVDKTQTTETIKTVVEQPKPVQKRKVMPKMPEVKPLIINLNGDSDTDEESDNKESKQFTNDAIDASVDIFLKEQRAQVEAKVAANVKTPVLKTKPSNNVMIKSSVKLLPKDKQIEYQKLLQQLSLAKKKMTSLKPKPVIRRPSKTKLPVSQNGDTTKNDINIFRQVYKEMQGQLNGRLQIQEKYKHLKPDILKIVEVNNQRRKLDKRVAELVEELKMTRLKFEQTQRLFHTRVHGLVLSKQKIDRSVKLKIVKKPAPPVKEKPVIPVVEPTKPLIQNVEAPIDPPINYGDPNDIDKILNLPKLAVEQSSLTNYISPLDMKRNDTIDPHGILCPFAIDGNCRDKDCSFKHIL